jgi:HSP20 family molecular chaperone IbpA
MNMTITRWDPFRELEDMNERLNRVFGRSALATAPAATTQGLFSFDWAPSVDIAETADAFEIKAELPDVKKEDVKVSVEDGELRISGERKRDKRRKGQEVSPHRAQLRFFHEELRAAAQRRRHEARRRVQGRRAQRASAEDGTGEAEGDRRQGELITPALLIAGAQH